MYKKTSIIIFTILLLSGSNAVAQRGKKHNKNSFDYELRAGINFCQIDGDGSGSYDKIGWHGALNTSFPIGLDDALRFQVEIGLSQKGSHVNQIDRYISLLYVEVPLLLSYNTMENRLRIMAGVASAILASSRVTTDGAYDKLQSENYKRMDALPLCLGVRYLFTEHIGVDLRYYNSMLNTAKENGTGTYRIFRSNKGQFNRLLQFGITMNF